MNEIFQQSSTSEKVSKQSESRADICKAASTPTYSFKLPTGNLNESGNATDSKEMRPNQAFTGGLALCTRGKVHCTSLHLSTERCDKTDAIADRSSDPRGHRSDPNSKVHPADGYDDRISTFATLPKSHPIPAQRYVKVGFYYSGKGDKVICPWCNLNLTEWETYDIPMEEHQKHSPYCSFVLMLNPFLNYHLL